MSARVAAVARDAAHGFSKRIVSEIEVIAGQGVAGDAHRGETVKHRSRVAVDPTQPNLRQVHLIHAELFDEMAERGFDICAGDLGENITTRGIDLTTRGIDLFALPSGTVLRIGDAALAVTGLRNPCGQIDAFRKGLLRAVLAKGENGEVIRKAGIMAIVLRSGAIRIGDAIAVEMPPEPHQPLERV